MSGAKPSLRLDFVLYSGDPDEGAEAVPSDRAVAEFGTLGPSFNLADVAYGAITLTRDGRALIDPKQDPIVGLLTKLVRTVSYVLDGELESLLLSESDHGFTFERVNEEVRIGFFRGNDPFEPDEPLLEGLLMPLEDFASQVIEMGDKIVALTQKVAPDRYKSDELCGGLMEFLEVAKSETKSYRLERNKNRRR